MIKKIQSQNGETIAETLIALLVSALALIMLAGAISASSHIISASRAKLDEYYQKEETLVSMSGADATLPTAVMTLKDSSGEIAEKFYSIRYDKNDVFGKTPVVAYKKTTP